MKSDILKCRFSILLHSLKKYQVYVKKIFSLITHFLLTIWFCCRSCSSCSSCSSCWPFVYFTKYSSKAFITKALGIHQVIRIASSSILTRCFSAWIINICFFIEFNSMQFKKIELKTRSSCFLKNFLDFSRRFGICRYHCQGRKNY